MDNYIHHAFNTLKAARLKRTRPRDVVIHLLSKNTKALTPYEIRDTLKRRRIKADVVTIYRVLETLETLSLVHKVLAFNGYVACHTTRERSGGCHHYLLCTACHSVSEVEGENLSKLEKKISTERQFIVESHYLEFMGLCASCRKRTPQKRG